MISGARRRKSSGTINRNEEYGQDDHHFNQEEHISLQLRNLGEAYYLPHGGIGEPHSDNKSK